ncbi:hypothetical protein VW29_06395 [Devosia limi DSM 17137]|uniref:YCII-related domain-containing protein n=1 Tax=Devosia limi DSM 17137 TaxID=1121477 RepID=A0A0F5LVI1_9HYPH|nr:YciI family protein [Devosia limi]KKB85647.1 hypothetical protein VW29_06395 [Devosia limi DSM 17137]SHF17220.1 hypothetical protein SAMN02745223_01939 [Devosia limi DSM 17137]
MLFAIIAQDQPDGVEHRMAVRPTHLEHLKTLGDKLVFAGPFLDENEKPYGSLMVIEAASLEEAKAMAAADPFAREKVFASYEVRRWNWGINNPDKRGQ